ncbi:S-layer homology domain-containing protein [Paenibacillus brevis]|uniref:S-layer homology domain-containing protein n=1 Tax=Paenibacillus brevis TaxID=2841508 RepID=A0ABS6FNB9_9BACL|nr:S-layer homology domain-containing protein [Paenibacillus brevis]MBU5670933.1 S-layer homology domain-containing protein [Paenibacillus brevis]
MSNTSYSFKENSHVIVNQGGEKKVMKKILSVALSTAMAFSMFASVAFGADANLNPQQKFDVLKQASIMDGMPDGSAALDKTLTRAELAKIIVKSIGLEEVNATSYNDKNYSIHWARTFIEAATQAGILEGTDAAKKLFNPSGNVTVQELAAVLVRALKLEVPTETNNNASEWAKGYVEAAVKAGFIDSSAVFTANATRSQAIVAAYAIYEAAQVPTVKSYEVKDSKNVEFTLSNGEVVKVELEKALVPNTETEVTFKTAAGEEITAKITWVVTEATKVDSATADNLKEVIVNFDGKVDKKSAENKDNYTVKGKTVSSATLLEDGQSVKLLLTEASTLENQKETEVKVKNVKTATTAKLLEATVKFTPVDVKIPEASKVTGLGTKAFKVEFSEPVKMGTVVTSNNYKVDGKTIGATIDYSYPNVAILSTELSVGTHKLVVSNVEDFSGLKIAPVEIEFTVVEDTEAPQPVAVTTNDLREATIEFDEPIKSLDKAYFNSTVNGATFTKADINDNKVTLHFANPLNLTENTIYLEGVTDYSNNKANREIKVTPSLDTERPEVVKTEIKQDDTTKNHKVVIEFNKKLDVASAQNKDNYKITDKDGKVFSLTGLNKDGHPVLAPVYDSAKNTVTIDLASKLDDGVYTLDVSGVKDGAYVPNTILPFTTKISASSAINGEITRAWTQQSATEDFLYIQFSKAIKTDGEGSALIKAKYTFAGNALTDDQDVQLVTADTVRLVAPKGEFVDVAGLAKGAVQVVLIQDADGNYLVQPGTGYILNIAAADFGSSLIQVKSGADNVQATSREEVKVVFAGKLSTVSAGDFRVKVGAVDYAPSTATLSADRTTVTLKFTGDTNKLPADLTGAIIYTVSQANIVTQDNFGSKIAEITAASLKGVQDKIKPVLVKDSANRIFTASTVTADTYDITLLFNKNLNDAGTVTTLTSLFKVKIGGKDATVSGATLTNGSNTIVLRVVADATVTVDANSIVSVDFSGNEGIKAVVSTSGANVLENFNEAAKLGEVIVTP